MILGLVCARAGSEGLPGKNLRKLGGRTLIAIAIEKTSACPLIDAVAISTDYTPDDVSWLRGYHIQRPIDLAGPLVSKWEVWRHAVRVWEAEVPHREPVTAIVDIDVTRPLTTAEDVAGTIAAFREQGHPAVLAASESPKDPRQDILRRIGPYVTRYEHSTHASRQELDPVYQHGGIVVVSREALMGGRAPVETWVGGLGYHEIPRAHCFDIDDELDWQIVEDQWYRQRSVPPFSRVEVAVFAS